MRFQKPCMNLVCAMFMAKDIDKAVECFNDAAHRGVPEAQYELGVCYRRGEGVEQDIKTALYWYEKAADQGYLRAYHYIWYYLSTWSWRNTYRL